MKQKQGKISRTTRSLIFFDQISDMVKTVGTSSRRIVNSTKEFFIPKPRVRSESFEAAIKRLNIKESDLRERAQGLKRSAQGYVIISLLVMAYGIYLVVVGSIAAIFVFAITIVLLVLAFREYFWYMQIKRRKLGAPFLERFQSLLRYRGKKK